MDREDLTISDAVAAMVDMGLEDSDDEAESEAEYNHDESGWRPHGSKAAGNSHHRSPGSANPDHADVYA
ncbi:hypothetical protein B0H10DRAFT_2224132 [Mycena sp. CBHHK59/15]|nr:hypothetical protein B0H10DRAFT_2224132 [Mycena sp. CBHHK59/15]